MDVSIFDTPTDTTSDRLTGRHFCAKQDNG